MFIFFIYSFMPFLYLLFKSATTQKRHRQLQVKDLPKVPTWRLGQDSNPRPSGRKVSSLPMRHKASLSHVKRLVMLHHNYLILVIISHNYETVKWRYNDCLVI